MTDTIRSTEADDSFLASRIAELARPTFSPEFTEWLACADIEEIEGAYAENYKDAHGIKARWVFNAGISRAEFANMFVSLGADLVEEEAREKAENAAMLAMLDSVGLSEWASRNNIRDPYDLWDHSFPYRTPDPEPLPYEALAA